MPLTSKGRKRAVSGDVRSTSDPFVSLKLGGKNSMLPTGGQGLKRGRTRVIERSLNPRWDEAFVFGGGEDDSGVTSDDTVELVLTIFDADRIRNDFLGKVSLPLKKIFGTRSGKTSGWFTLKGKKAQGKIHVRMQIDTTRGGSVVTSSNVTNIDAGKIKLGIKLLPSPDPAHSTTAKLAMRVLKSDMGVKKMLQQSSVGNSVDASRSLEVRVENAVASLLGVLDEAVNVAAAAGDIPAEAKMRGKGEFNGPHGDISRAGEVAGDVAMPAKIKRDYIAGFRLLDEDLGDRGGVLQTNEFLDVLAKLGVEGEDVMEGVFARFDTQNDGTITYHEFARFIRERGKVAEAPLTGLSKDATQKDVEIFEQELLDDGTHPFGFEAAVNALLRTMDMGAKHHHDGTVEWERAFMKMDVDGNGRISMPELDRALRELGVTSDAEIIHGIGVRIDVNLDGFIDYEELASFMRKRGVPGVEKQPDLREHIMTASGLLLEGLVSLCEKNTPGVNPATGDLRGAWPRFCRGSTVVDLKTFFKSTKELGVESEVQKATPKDVTKPRQLLKAVFEAIDVAPPDTTITYSELSAWVQEKLGNTSSHSHSNQDSRGAADNSSSLKHRDSDKRKETLDDKETKSELEVAIETVLSYLIDTADFGPNGEIDVQDAFLLIDQSGDGRLSNTELEDTLSDIGLTCTKATMHRVVELFDMDCDGMVDYDDFRRFVESEGAGYCTGFVSRRNADAAAKLEHDDRTNAATLIQSKFRTKKEVRRVSALKEKASGAPAGTISVRVMRARGLVQPGGGSANKNGEDWGIRFPLLAPSVHPTVTAALIVADDIDEAKLHGDEKAQAVHGERIISGGETAPSDEGGPRPTWAPHVRKGRRRHRDKNLLTLHYPGPSKASVDTGGDAYSSVAQQRRLNKNRRIVQPKLRVELKAGKNSLGFVNIGLATKEGKGALLLKQPFGTSVEEWFTLRPPPHLVSLEERRAGSAKPGSPRSGVPRSLQVTVLSATGLTSVSSKSKKVLDDSSSRANACPYVMVSCGNTPLKGQRRRRGKPKPGQTPNAMFTTNPRWTDGNVFVFGDESTGGVVHTEEVVCQILNHRQLKRPEEMGVVRVPLEPLFQAAMFAHDNATTTRLSYTVGPSKRHLRDDYYGPAATGRIELELHLSPIFDHDRGSKAAVAGHAGGTRADVPSSSPGEYKEHSRAPPQLRLKLRFDPGGTEEEIEKQRNIAATTIQSQFRKRDASREVRAKLLGSRGTVTVIVLKGEKLPDKDKGILTGAMDPYVQLTLLPWEKKPSARTKPVQGGGSNPIWDRKRHKSMLTLTYPGFSDANVAPIVTPRGKNVVHAKEPKVRIEVMDDDLGKNDFVGSADLDLTDVLLGGTQKQEIWVHLTDEPHTFQEQDTNPSHSIAAVNTVDSTDVLSPRESDLERTLVVTVLRARGLRAADFSGGGLLKKGNATSSDPYVVVRCGEARPLGGKGSKAGRTAVVSSTLTPEWNEIFTFGGGKVTAKKRKKHDFVTVKDMLEISVLDYDKGVLDKDDKLGTVRIPVRDIVAKCRDAVASTQIASVTEWFDLAGIGAGDAGQIELTLETRLRDGSMETPLVKTSTKTAEPALELVKTPPQRGKKAGRLLIVAWFKRDRDDYYKNDSDGAVGAELLGPAVIAEDDTGRIEVSIRFVPTFFTLPDDDVVMSESNAGTASDGNGNMLMMSGYHGGVAIPSKPLGEVLIWVLEASGLNRVRPAEPARGLGPTKIPLDAEIHDPRTFATLWHRALDGTSDIGNGFAAGGPVTVHGGRGKHRQVTTTLPVVGGGANPCWTSSEKMMLRLVVPQGPPSLSELCVRLTVSIDADEVPTFASTEVAAVRNDALDKRVPGGRVGELLLPLSPFAENAGATLEQWWALRPPMTCDPTAWATPAGASPDAVVGGYNSNMNLSEGVGRSQIASDSTTQRRGSVAATVGAHAEKSSANEPIHLSGEDDVYGFGRLRLRVCYLMQDSLSASIQSENLAEQNRRLRDHALGASRIALREESTTTGELRTQALPSIWRACKEGDLLSVNALVAAEPAVATAPNPRGWTPLHFAVRYGHHKVVHALLKAGAVNEGNLDAKGRKPSDFSRSVRMLKLLGVLAPSSQPVTRRSRNAAITKIISHIDQAGNRKSGANTKVAERERKDATARAKAGLKLNAGIKASADMTRGPSSNRGSNRLVPSGSVVAAFGVITNVLREVSVASSVGELYALLCADAETSLDVDDFEGGVKLLLDSPRNIDPAFIAAVQAIGTRLAIGDKNPVPKLVHVLETYENVDTATIEHVARTAGGPTKHHSSRAPENAEETQSRYIKENVFSSFLTHNGVDASSAGPFSVHHKGTKAAMNELRLLVDTLCEVCGDGGGGIDFAIAHDVFLQAGKRSPPQSAGAKKLRSNTSSSSDETVLNKSFSLSLQAMGVGIKSANVLVKHFDPDGNGNINMLEFESALHVALAERDADDRLELRTVIGMLQRMMSDYASAGGGGKAMQHASLREMFSKFDDDGSNSVSYDELGTMLERMELCFNPRVMRMLCARFDGNGDGSIDWLEFVRFMEAGGKASGKSTSRAIDAVIEVVEAAGNDVNEVFSMFDLDNSGSISQPELRSGLEQLGFIDPGVSAEVFDLLANGRDQHESGVKPSGAGEVSLSRSAFTSFVEAKLADRAAKHATRLAAVRARIKTKNASTVDTEATIQNSGVNNASRTEDKIKFVGGVERLRKSLNLPLRRGGSAKEHEVYEVRWAADVLVRRARVTGKGRLSLASVGSWMPVYVTQYNKHDGLLCVEYIYSGDRAAFSRSPERWQQQRSGSVKRAAGIVALAGDRVRLIRCMDDKTSQIFVGLKRQLAALAAVSSTAACTLQRSFRSYCRRKEGREWRRQKVADRKAETMEQQRHFNAARNIQAGARGYLGRKRVRRARRRRAVRIKREKKERGAAVIIQRSARGYFVRTGGLEARRARKNTCATRIQARYRGHLTRTEEERARQRRDAAKLDAVRLTLGGGFMADVDVDAPAISDAPVRFSAIVAPSYYSGSPLYVLSVSPEGAANLDGTETRDRVYKILKSYGISDPANELNLDLGTDGSAVKDAFERGQEEGEAAAMANALAAAVVEVYDNHDPIKVAKDLRSAMVLETFWRRLVFVQHDDYTSYCWVSFSKSVGGKKRRVLKYQELFDLDRVRDPVVDAVRHVARIAAEVDIWNAILALLEPNKLRVVTRQQLRNVTRNKRQRVQDGQDNGDDSGSAGDAEDGDEDEDMSSEESSGEEGDLLNIEEDAVEAAVALADDFESSEDHELGLTFLSSLAILERPDPKDNNRPKETKRSYQYAVMLKKKGKERKKRKKRHTQGMLDAKFDVKLRSMNVPCETEEDTRARVNIVPRTLKRGDFVERMLKSHLRPPINCAPFIQRPKYADAFDEVDGTRVRFVLGEGDEELAAIDAEAAQKAAEQDVAVHWLIDVEFDGIWGAGKIDTYRPVNSTVRVSVPEGELGWFSLGQCRGLLRLVAQVDVSSDALFDILALKLDPSDEAPALFTRALRAMRKMLRTTDEAAAARAFERIESGSSGRGKFETLKLNAFVRETQSLIEILGEVEGAAFDDTDTSHENKQNRESKHPTANTTGGNYTDIVDDRVSRFVGMFDPEASGVIAFRQWAALLLPTDSSEVKPADEFATALRALRRIILREAGNPVDTEIKPGDVQRPFRRFDRDGSGRILRVDFVKVLRRLPGIKEALPTHEALSTFVARIDKDGDGFIDMREFSALVSTAKAAADASGAWEESEIDYQETMRRLRLAPPEIPVDALPEQRLRLWEERFEPFDTGIANRGPGKANRSGVVRRLDFNGVLKRLGVLRILPTGRTLDNLAARFELPGDDGSPPGPEVKATDRSVDYLAFIKGMTVAARMGMALTEEETEAALKGLRRIVLRDAEPGERLPDLQRTFDTFDIDGDGTVTVDEFTSALLELGLGRVFGTRKTPYEDKDDHDDGDGSDDGAEAKQRVEERVRHFARSFDADGDGTVDHLEFLRVLLDLAVKPKPRHSVFATDEQVAALVQSDDEEDAEILGKIYDEGDSVGLRAALRHALCELRYISLRSADPDCSGNYDLARPFKIFDYDGNGTVALRDFERALRLLGIKAGVGSNAIIAEGAAVHRFAERLMRTDSGADRKIDYAEFMRIVGRRRPRLAPREDSDSQLATVRWELELYFEEEKTWLKGVAKRYRRLDHSALIELKAWRDFPGQDVGYLQLNEFPIVLKRNLWGGKPWGRDPLWHEVFRAQPDRKTLEDELGLDEDDEISTARSSLPPSSMPNTSRTDEDEQADDSDEQASGEKMKIHEGSAEPTSMLADSSGDDNSAVDESSNSVKRKLFTDAG